MTVKVKIGAVGAGSWSAAVADGKVRLNWKDAWENASLVRVKDGIVGGGFWRDSGYEGPPHPPQNINVGTWDNTNFDSITIDWNLPETGGSPIHHYEVEMRGSGGVLFDTKTPGVPPTSAFVVHADDKIQFRVRSVSSSGQVSDWTSYLQVLMGHPEVSHTRVENKTRSWYREVSGPWYRDAFDSGVTVIKVPTDVVINKFHYDLRAQGGFTSVLSPAVGGREVKMVVFGVDYNTMNMGSPYEVVDGGNSFQGDGSVWGLRCRGDGWSATASGSNKMLGTFGITGTETYQDTTKVIDVAYRANGYW